MTTPGDSPHNRAPLCCGEPVVGCFGDHAPTMHRYPFDICVLHDRPSSTPLTVRGLEA